MCVCVCVSKTEREREINLHMVNLVTFFPSLCWVAVIFVAQRPQKLSDIHSSMQVTAEPRTATRQLGSHTNFHPGFVRCTEKRQILTLFHSVNFGGSFCGDWLTSTTAVKLLELAEQCKLYQQRDKEAFPCIIIKNTCKSL